MTPQGNIFHINKVIPIFIPNIFIQENVFENVFSDMAAMCSNPRVIMIPLVAYDACW